MKLKRLLHYIFAKPKLFGFELYDFVCFKKHWGPYIDAHAPAARLRFLFARSALYAKKTKENI
jgi:hypothetical protein